MSSCAAVELHDFAPAEALFRDEVLQGLACKPKTIPPKFFYDQRGSELFDAICELPEYYPTRTEERILADNLDEIARLTPAGSALIELGSGASKKVRLLLEHLRPAAYVGVDISREFLLSATQRLAQDHPWLEVHATCADFSLDLRLPKLSGPQHRLAFFPGSSIGNFEPNDARRFLARVGARLGRGDGLLVGVDLKKDPTVLNAAYNDSRGITAQFNLNLLHRMQRELGASLDLDGFEHLAGYNAQGGRVEMHLVSRHRQSIRIEGRRFDFEPGETIHTENSYKYSIPEFQALADDAGFAPEAVWTDGEQLFSVHYLRWR